MRKLAIGALSFSFAVFASCYLLPVKAIPYLAIFFLCIGILLLFKKRKWLRAVVISVFAISFGLGCFYLKYNRTVLSAHTLDGQTMKISGKLLEYPFKGDNYTLFKIKIVQDDLPELNATTFLGGYKSIEAEPGDTLTFEAKLKSSDVQYGKRSFRRISDNVFINASVKSDIEVTEGGFSISAVPVKINHKIANLTEELFPSDVYPFMKSLLLGDKADFNKDISLKTSMSLAGLMHVVAISGMHIAYLVGFIKLLLGNTRHSSILCILMVWFFVFITGAHPSAMRAGIMQTFLLMAPIVNRENDPLTSLSTALALILFMNPYAVASVGLQLSFASMAGLYCFAGKINRKILDKIKKRKVKKIMLAPVASIASSLSVMVFTMPLTAMHFGYISLYSVLSNILVFWAVSLCFCSGAVICILGSFWKAPAIFLGNVLAFFVRYIIVIARFIASLPLSAVYMNTPYGVAWLVLTYALFAVAFLSKAKLKAKIILPLSLSAFCLISAYNITKLSYLSCGGVITVHDIGQGQCISLINGDTTVVYDCGGMANTKNAGDIAGAYLKGRGRNNIDLLVLSHLQKDHANGVTKLMELCDIKKIIIPAYDYTNNRYYDEIAESAVRHGIEIHFLSHDEEIDYKGMSIKLFGPVESKDINECSIKLLASFGSYDMLATGDASKSVERKLIAEHDIKDVELLIAGHHGSKGSSSPELLESIGADTAVISCGWNSFGHPSDETLEALHKYGYNVYRTDLDGRVELRIGKSYG